MEGSPSPSRETTSLAEYAASNVTASLVVGGGLLLAEDVDFGDNATLSYDVVGGDGTRLLTIASLSSSGFAVRKQANALLDFESNPKSWTLQVRVRDNGGSSKIGTACTVGAAGACDAGSFCFSGRCYESCPMYTNGTVNATADALNSTRTDLFFCPMGVPTGFTVVPGQVPFREQAVVTVTVSVLDRDDPPFVDLGSFDGSAPTILTNPSCVVQAVASQALNGFGADQDVVKALTIYDADVPNPGPNAAPFVVAAVPCAASGLPSPAPGANPTSCLWSVANVADAATGRISIPGAPTSVVTVGQNATMGYVSITDTGGASSWCLVNLTVVLSGSPPDLGPDFSVAGVYEAGVTPISTVVLPRWPLNDSTIDPFTAALVNPDILTFSMSASSFFAINATNARIWLVDTPDYETRQSFTLIVRVTTNRGMSDFAQVTVPIIDVNEPPAWVIRPDALSGYFELSLPENSPNMTLVANFSSMGAATDPDTLNALWSSLSYSVVSCSANPCPFVIPGSGVRGGNTSLVVAAPTPVLDFESATNKWTMVVRVTDGGGLFADLPVRVSLTNVNEPPWISSQTVSVLEGPGGSSLLDMTGLIGDPDAYDTPATLVVSITAGGAGGFSISNGRLMVNANAVLDYEDVRLYTLTVVVTDSFGLTAAGTFVVNVNNRNDVSVTSASVVSGSGVGPGGALLRCDGSAPTKVRLTGTDFGLKQPANASQAAAFVLSYRRTVSVGEPAPPVFSTSDCAVTSGAGTNTQLDCNITAGGAGSQLVFWLAVTVPTTQISGDTSAALGTAVAFAGPVVSAVVGPFPLQTSGGQSLTITGSCLGRAADALVFAPSSARDSFVQLCTDDDGCRALSGCQATSLDGSSVTCPSGSLPGIGTSLRWSVSVARATSGTLVFGAFAAPNITSVSVTTLATSGVVPNDAIDFVGTNFAGLGAVPAVAQLVYPLSPGGATSYALVGCTVVTAYTRVRCTRHDPGVGNPVFAYLTFGGQTNAYSPTLAFAAPTLVSVRAPGTLATVGGDLVSLFGSNFGPACGVSGGTNCANVVAAYSRGSLSTATGLRLVYAPAQCAVVSDSQMERHGWKPAREREQQRGRGHDVVHPTRRGRVLGPGRHRRAHVGRAKRRAARRELWTSGRGASHGHVRQVQRHGRVLRVGMLRVAGALGDHVPNRARCRRPARLDRGGGRPNERGAALGLRSTRRGRRHAARDGCGAAVQRVRCGRAARSARRRQFWPARPGLPRASRVRPALVSVVV